MNLQVWIVIANMMCKNIKQLHFFVFIEMKEIGNPSKFALCVNKI